MTTNPTAINSIQELNVLSQAVSENFEKGTLVAVVFGKYRGAEDLKKATARAVQTKSGKVLSVELLTATQSFSRSLAVSEFKEILIELIDRGFRAVFVRTDEFELVLEFSRKMVPHLFRRKSSEKVIPGDAHNRQRRRILPASSSWMHALGITSADGAIRREMGDKARQIEKFIEIVDSLLRQGGEDVDKDFVVTDFGSGKSYLTFALHEYLTSKRKLKASVKGIECRRDLVTLSNRLAAELGLTGLKFEEGSIASAKDSPLDMAIALHACNTATDDALAYAVRNGARYVVVAPCCHQEVRPQLALPDDLRPVLGHGILEARLADSLTDGLRALVLSAFGYETKVFEFISPEHTAKNVMITAVRKREPEMPSRQTLNEARRVMSKFGVTHLTLLEELAGEGRL